MIVSMTITQKVAFEGVEMKVILKQKSMMIHETLNSLFN